MDILLQSDKVYLDHAATTPLDPKVLEAMLPYLKESFGNPSSSHWLGEQAADAVEHARGVIAKAVGVNPRQVIFTSGGTEADNLGVHLAVGQGGVGGLKRPVRVSSIEHPAVRDAAHALQQSGFDVVEIPVSRDGVLDEEAVQKVMLPHALVAVMHVNNEVGTIQPVGEVAEVVRDDGGLLFVDCVQSFLKLPVGLDQLSADALAVSAHKVYGPKGVGAFIYQEGAVVSKVLHGGGQEFDLRSGTPSVANIVGFGKAVQEGWPVDEEVMQKMQMLRDKLMDGILELIPGSLVNGSRQHRVCNNVNVAFERIEGRALVEWLSAQGVCVSLGSACSSSQLEPSHVLTAMGLTAEQALGSLRFTIGKDTSTEEIDRVLELLQEGVWKLRAKGKR